MMSWLRKTKRGICACARPLHSTRGRDRLWRISMHSPVDVHHPSQTALDMHPLSLDGLMGAPAGAKPVGTVGETRVEHRAQHLMHCLLDEPVEDGGDSQHPCAASRFGYFHFTHRLRAILSRQQFFSDVRPSFLRLANPGRE